MSLIDNPQTPAPCSTTCCARHATALNSKCAARCADPFCRLVSISVGDTRYPGMSREISASGMGLLHPEELPLGEAEICIRLDDSDVVVRRRIQWCRPLGEGWYISGALFTDVVDD